MQVVKRIQKKLGKDGTPTEGITEQN